MSKIIVFVALLVFVDAAPKHPKFKEHPNHLKLVPCSNDNDRLRTELEHQSACGAPKEVFTALNPPTYNDQVIPSHVWIKRCQGLCTHGNCHPTKINKRLIPVRIYNAKNDTESCWMYEVEEHVSCGCCTASECSHNKVFNHRKCSCQCPNAQERRSCLRKRDKRWNRAKCICERKRRMK